MPLVPIRLLVLSDIHFGGLNGYAQLGSTHHAPTPYEKDIVADLIRVLLAGHMPITHIVVPGDLTSYASPAEFAGCLEAVYGIADAVGVPRDRVFFTFGNHDTNWKISELAKPKKPKNAPQDLGYYRVSCSVGSIFIDNPSHVEEGPMIGSGVATEPSLELFILNTGYASTHDQAPRNGKVGHEQLEWLKQKLQGMPRTLDRWRVVMHHPFNYVYPSPVADLSQAEEGADLVKEFGQWGVDFVCHGHRHHPYLLTRFETDWRSPITFLCAGSFSVGEEERAKGAIPNTFHVVDLVGRAPTEAATGRVTSYQFDRDNGWTLATFSNKVRLDGVQHFGHPAERSECIELLERQFADLKVANDFKKHCLAPAHHDLPDALKCLTLDRLQEYCETVATGLDIEMVGTYPKKVMLKWT